MQHEVVESGENSSTYRAEKLCSAALTRIVRSLRPERLGTRYLACQFLQAFALLTLTVQVYYCPGLLLSRFITVQVYYCPGLLLSRFITVQVYYCPGFFTYREWGTVPSP